MINSLLRTHPKLQDHFLISAEVQRALTMNLPIVALESAVITHGLPQPHNLSLAQDMEQEIRNQSGVPATIAVLDGKIKIGLSIAEIEKISREKNVKKISRRDFPAAIIQKATGGTTVSGTAFAAHKVGVKIFATGGIGGVHIKPEYDISSDLITLANTPLIIVCAGAKAILDLPATLEYLETMGIPVLGYQTDEFPAFYSKESGLKVSVRCNSPQEIVDFASAHKEIGLSSAILVTQPPPEQHSIPRESLDGYIRRSIEDGDRQGIHGQALTPFLLKRMAELSNNATIRTNIALLINNAHLATQIARAMQTKPHRRVI